MIRHELSIRLEHYISEAYKCERFGLYGIANADYLDIYPFDAFLVLIPFFYARNLSEEKILDVYDYRNLLKDQSNEEVYLKCLEEFSNKLRALLKEANRNTF